MLDELFKRVDYLVLSICYYHIEGKLAKGTVVVTAPVAVVRLVRNAPDTPRFPHEFQSAHYHLIPGIRQLPGSITPCFEADGDLIDLGPMRIGWK